jgi:hypothetical protein
MKEIYGEISPFRQFDYRQKCIDHRNGEGRKHPRNRHAGSAAKCDQLKILSTGKVTGDAEVNSIIIEEGATFIGKCKTLEEVQQDRALTTFGCCGLTKLKKHEQNTIRRPLDLHGF